MCCRRVWLLAGRPGDEPGRLNHAIVKQRPLELPAKLHTATWLVTETFSLISACRALSPEDNATPVSNQELTE